MFSSLPHAHTAPPFLLTCCTSLCGLGSRLPQAITAIVQRAVTFVDELNTTSELEQKLELINVLRTISEGKIYVENERARLTKILAGIKEAAGQVKEASEILQEVQVETYGSMEKKEKTDFILEQTRLCLDSKDFVRGLIIARKINPKVLTEEGFDVRPPSFMLASLTCVVAFF